MQDLLQNTPSGLYCPAGDFFIDPWAPVDRAVGEGALGAGGEKVGDAPAFGVVEVGLSGVGAEVADDVQVIGLGVGEGDGAAQFVDGHLRC